MNALLYDLTMLNAIPANEKQVRLFFEKTVKPLADELTYDNIGSIIAKKVGNPDGPRIMVAGHMDEIGFIVTEITKEGYVKFIPAGGWWGHVVLSQQFTITTKKGTVTGVVGSKPPHILSEAERKNVVDLKDMYLDLGVASKEEAEQLGVAIGDMITPYIVSKELGNPKYLLAKAFDNRIGVALAIDVLKNIQLERHDNVYYGVGTVQEEVGLRGAQTAAYKVDPDIGISLDVTIAHDYPGGTQETQLGKGPCLMVYDSSMVGHVGLRQFAVSIADELKIPYQLSYLRQGGTDAGKMHISKCGAPSLAICLPCRYLHSHTSIIHEDDYLNAVKLVTELVKRLDRKTVNAITFDHE